MCAVNTLECGKLKDRYMRKHATERRQDSRGQSLVELTLFLPLLLLMLAGLVEIGVLVNGYITALDASRAAARYVSPSDPSLTRCQPFSNSGTGLSITFGADPCYGEYLAKAATVKSWGATLAYQTCYNSPTRNFYYVAGCMAVLNLPNGGLDPNPKTIWTTNDYAGDDVIVATIPITAGQPVYDENARWWSFYGNQPTPAFPSYVISPTGSGTFVVTPDFVSKLGSYAIAPATGIVVVEVYHAQKHFLGLFNPLSGMVGGSAIIPNPIPIHTFTIFPLVAIEP
jgi:hypothetical protein